ncbi:hypothetical protein C8Q75DRAFT_283515 [Abortiporus biennis]|nr:hypothetical protein C8Q75DRAFT_283515 [Abortiporus biennis]
MSTSGYESMPVPSGSGAHHLCTSPYQSEITSPSASSSSWANVKVEVQTPLLTVSDSFDSLCLSPADDTHLHQPSLNSSLIPSSSSRPFRPPTLQPANDRPNPHQFATLLPNFRHPPHYNSREDVLPSALIASSTSDTSEHTSHHGFSPGQTNKLSSSPSNYESLNYSTARLRTSPHPVFHTTSALAAHHGIPQSLPPVPRTTRFRTDSSVSTSSPSTSSNDFDFSSLCSNYLNMLSQKPEEHSTGVAAPSAATSAPAQTDNVAAVQALMEVIQGEYSGVLVNATKGDAE